MSLIPIATLLRYHRDRRGRDAIALVSGNERVTFTQLENRANQRARLFQKLGVKSGDFVMIALSNGALFYECTFAVWKLGATPTVVSPKLPTAEIRAITELARPALIVGADQHHLAEWLSSSPAAPIDMFSEQPLPETVSKYIKAMTSGGSTGRPKIIVDHSPALYDPSVSLFRHVSNDVVLNPGPLFYNGPFMITHIGLFLGNTIVNMMRFDAEEALRLIEQHQVSFVMFVPTMMSRILALPDEIRLKYDVSSLRLVWHMAAPMPIWVKERWIEWLGSDRILELYGGTERQGFTTITGEEWLQRKGSVGRMVSGKSKVLREDGSECCPGELGEVFMMPDAGPGSTYHYIGADAKTRDGWESLGDMGWLDEEGYMFLADRRTDLILRGGVNIYPAEIESALSADPHVASVIVVGVPDADLGQRVHAIVELKSGEAMTPNELHHFLMQRLAKNKLPESYEWASHSLRDDGGKVRRSYLRDERCMWLKEGRDFQLKPG